jgi:hypothetical protein
LKEVKAQMEWLLKERVQKEQYVELLEDEIQAMTAKLKDCDASKVGFASA